MVRLFPKSQILAHEDKIKKWTEIEVGDKKIEVFLEKTLLGELKNPEDFILDGQIWKMVKWSRSYLFLKYK